MLTRTDDGRQTLACDCCGRRADVDDVNEVWVLFGKDGPDVCQACAQLPLASVVRRLKALAQLRAIVEAGGCDA